MTHSFQTTTILYYTFFLPGVLLHEFSTWLVAGMLNVHATSSLQWPEAQEIAELDLSFVELARNISPLRLAVITLAPIVTGLAAVALIANNIMDFNVFFATLRTGELSDVSTAIMGLTSTTDFWLWTYLLFVIGNTMFPRLGNLKGLRRLLIAVAVVLGIFIALGLGEPVVVRLLRGPVADALNMLSATFVIIIFIDVFFVVLLGTVEAIIERVTGHSATFRRGKLVAMTRQERIEEQRRRAQREARAQQRARELPKETGRPSIYNRPLAIPGAPGVEAVTQGETLIIGTEERPALSGPPRPDSRRGPDMIEATAARQRPAAAPALANSLPGDDGAADDPDDEDDVTIDEAPEDELDEAFDAIDDSRELIRSRTGDPRHHPGQARCSRVRSGGRRWRPHRSARQDDWRADTQPLPVRRSGRRT